MGDLREITCGMPRAEASVMRWFIIAVAVTGCSSPDARTPLAELSDAPMAVFVKHAATDGTFLGGTSRVSVELDTTAAGCVSLPSNATARFGNLTAPFGSLPLTISDASYNDIDDFCIGVGMIGELDASLFVSQPSQLEISDGTTTWDVELVGTDADLTVGPVVAGATTSVTWNGGPPIGDAALWYLDPQNHDAEISSMGGGNPAIHIHDNSVDVDIPADMPPQQVVEIELDSTVTLGPTPDATGSSCVGPTTCTAEMNVQKYEAVVAQP
jgi:hypothetical protein